jgi:hypothetical protein
VAGTCANGRTWTGLSLDDLVGRLRTTWPEGNQSLLFQIHAFLIRTANQLLQHSPLGVSSTLEHHTDELRRYNVGPSTRYVEEALLVAFSSYAEQ